MKKKPVVTLAEDDLLINLTFYNVSSALLLEFIQKIVKPYYNGNLNVAIHDLLQKTLAEQDFVVSHITFARNSMGT